MNEQTITNVKQWMEAGKPKGYQTGTPYGKVAMMDGRKMFTWYEILVKLRSDPDYLHGWIHCEPTDTIEPEPVQP